MTASLQFETPVRVAVLPMNDVACATWRLIQPYSAINEKDIKISFPPAKIKETDIVLVQRLSSHKDLSSIAKIKESGVKVIIDYDDLLNIDPLGNINDPESLAECEKYMKECIIAADAISVSTPELAAILSKINPKCFLLVNALKVGELLSKGSIRRLSDKTTLFWSGSVTHILNLHLIKEAVCKIISERSDTVFVISGPELLCELFARPETADKIIHVANLPFDTFLRLSSVADINLAPLLPSAFNDAKSEIRLLQAGAWGVPSIASPAAPYRRFAQHWTGSGEACLIVEDNSPEGWYQAIRKLVENRALRQAMGRRAQQVVTSKYDLDKVNRLRIQMLHSVLER